MKTYISFLVFPFWFVSSFSCANLPRASFQYKSTIGFNGNRTNKKSSLYVASARVDTISKHQQYEIEILSEDPKCFLVHNFLSPEECKTFISKADNNGGESESESDRMQRSNAPKVSMQMKRLWPLPFLCLGAGIPPIIRLFENNPSSTGIEDVISVAAPPIAIAFSAILLLIFVVPIAIQSYADITSRTSQSVALNKEQDYELIRNLVHRASDITEHDWSCWEAPVITKYEKGALFASHNDASPTRGSEWMDLGGQRVVTVIAYLNTCLNGGATKFDQLGFEVTPSEGSALVFYPADKVTLEADGRTEHQSLPAVDDKYICQLFGRLGRVPSPLGIPDSFGK